MTAHLSWVDAAVDRVVVPSEVVANRCARDGTPADRYVPLGLPVAAEFCRPPLDEAQRRELKRELGLRGEFLVVLTGGAEGSGRLRRCAAAILRQVADVDVVVICGRNRSLRRRVGRLAERTGDGRLTAQGFVGNMADWLRCADIVVGQGGPGHDRGGDLLRRPAGADLVRARPGEGKRRVRHRRRGPACTRPGRGSSRPRSAGCAATRPRSALCATRRPGPAAPARPSTSPASSPSWPTRRWRSRRWRSRPWPAWPRRRAWTCRSAVTTRALAGPASCCPALMAETAAMGRPLVFSVADGADSDRRARASASLRRLRRSGVLIRAALRDR